MEPDGCRSPLRVAAACGGEEGRKKCGILQEGAWPTCLNHCQQMGVGGGDLGNRLIGTVHPARQSEPLGVMFGIHMSTGNQSDADLILRPWHQVKHRLESQADPVPGWGSSCRKRGRLRGDTEWTDLLRKHWPKEKGKGGHHCNNGAGVREIKMEKVLFRLQKQESRPLTYLDIAWIPCLLTSTASQGAC